MSVTHADICEIIQASLSVGLLTPKWRKLVTPDAPSVAGLCSVATGAFYYLSGGHRAGMMPFVSSFYRNDGGDIEFGLHPDKEQRLSHWWVQGPDGAIRGAGEAFDPTEAQFQNDFPDGFPHQTGRGCGFQHPKQIPTKRDQVVIARVKAELGEGEIAQYRRENIGNFIESCESLGMDVSEILKRKPNKNIWAQIQRAQNQAMSIDMGIQSPV